MLFCAQIIVKCFTMRDYERSEFLSQWGYQQKQSFSRIKELTRLLLLYFPLGYIQSIVNVIYAILTLPIILARGLYHWLFTALVREINIKDIMGLEGHELELMRKQGIKNIKFSVDFLGKTTAFIAGVIVTLLTLYFTSR